MRLTSLRLTRSPRLSTSWSTRRALLRAALAALGTDQLAGLDLHQLLSQPAHALAQHIGVLIDQHLPDDLLDRHPVCSGHRRRLLLRTFSKSDEHEHRGGRNDPQRRSVRPALTPTVGTRPGSPADAFIEVTGLTRRGTPR